MGCSRSKSSSAQASEEAKSSAAQVSDKEASSAAQVGHDSEQGLPNILDSDGASAAPGTAEAKQATTKGKRPARTEPEGPLHQPVVSTMHFDGLLPGDDACSGKAALQAPIETDALQDCTGGHQLETSQELETTQDLGAQHVSRSPAEATLRPPAERSHIKGKKGVSTASPQFSSAIGHPTLSQLSLTEKTCVLEDVRQQGKTRLQIAYVDGRLMNLLRSGANLVPDLGDVKAAYLVPDIRDVKADAFRNWAKGKLLESSSQGTLDTVTALLAKLAVPASPRRPQEAKATPPTTSQASCTSCSSSEVKAGAGLGPARVGGAEDLSVADARQAPRQPKTAEGRRILQGRARKWLSEAYADCRLSKAARLQSTLVPDTHSAKASEFRRQARQTLLQSQSDGRLEMLVFALTFSYSDVEPCRAALGKGRLEQVQKLYTMPGASGIKGTLNSALQQPLVASWYHDATQK